MWTRLKWFVSSVCQDQLIIPQFLKCNIGHGGQGLGTHHGGAETREQRGWKSTGSGGREGGDRYLKVAGIVKKKGNILQHCLIFCNGKNSLGPGSFVGNRAKNIGERSGYWRPGKGATEPPPPPLSYPPGSLRLPILFFAPFPTKEPGPRLWKKHGRKPLLKGRDTGVYGTPMSPFPAHVRTSAQKSNYPQTYKFKL